MDYPIRTLDQIRPFLLSYRKAHKLSQAKLAGRLGVSQQSYAALEARPESVSVTRLFEVLQALDVALIFGTGSHPVETPAAGPVLTAKRASSTPRPREDW